jgi:G3E family GTPase
MRLSRRTADPRGPTPIAIIGGFLGSGKTSLLTHILSADHGLRVAVLINDFGEINIDAQLVIAVEGQSTISLVNGCICCTIRDDLLTEVSRLIAMQPPPEYIVIETSGVSDPAAVAQTFLLDLQRKQVEVDAIISVLDADLSSIPDDYQALARSQVEVADIVVLNKTDLVSAEQLAAMRQYVKRAVPRARLLETTHGRVPVEMVLGINAFDATRRDLDHADAVHVEHDGCCQSGCRHAPLAHNHGEMFATWTYRTDRPFSFGALQRAIEHLPEDIYRAKGKVKLDIDAGERGILQVTGRRGWLTLDGAWHVNEEPVTELVCIGRPGAVTRDRICDHFNKALDDAGRFAEEGYLIEDLRAFSVAFV